MPMRTAPSGLVADLRKVKGVEMIKLAEQSSDQGPAAGFTTILDGCWTTTVDPGPYSFLVAGDAKPPWAKMLKGDVLDVFIFLRRISMPDGDTYDFDVRCEECKQRYGWTVNLSELPVKELPPDSATRVRTGQAFETKLLDGRAVTFDLQCIAQEEPLTRLMRQQKRTGTTLVDLLAAQTRSIDGVGLDIASKWRALADLAMDDLYNLREDYAAADCGLETAIQTRCTDRACGWIQDVNLPLGKTFFAPRRKTKKETDEPATRDWFQDSGKGSTSLTSGPSSITSSGPNTGEAGTG